MPIPDPITVSALVDTFMQSADLPAAQATLGIATGLPVWMFDAADGSAPDAGCFTTDSATPNLVTTIRISVSDKNGGDPWYTVFADGAMQLPCDISIVDPTGKIVVYLIEAFTTESVDYSTLTVAYKLATPGKTFTNEAYFFSFIPGAAVVPTITQVLQTSGITTFTQFLAIFGITAAPSGTVTPVTSITTSDGAQTSIS